MSEVYAITNIYGYVSQMRETAANSLTENETQDNLDNYISIDQMISLVRTKCLGFDDNNRPLLDEKTNEDIFEETAIWIHNVGLAKLAAQDLVECAWDSELNDMVFWAKENKVVQHESNKPKRNSRKNKKS